MKLLCILLFAFLLQVEAQRRSQVRHETTHGEQAVRTRGRSRFSNPESEQTIENTNRRIPSRRRPTSTETPIEIPVERQNYPEPITPSTASYAVEENIDEGDLVPQPRISSENSLEFQDLQTKLKDIGTQSEQSSSLGGDQENHKFSQEEEEIPTVRIESDRVPSSGTAYKVESPKSTEKSVPITRNNVRNGGGKTSSERRTDVRNGNSRTIEKSPKNGSSRLPNENTVSRSGPIRTRGRNSISVQKNTGSRTSNNIDLPIPKVDLESGTFSLKTDGVESSNSLPVQETLKDENEIREQIVRNSVPQLPQPIGFPTEVRDSSSKKPIRKTIRTRINENIQSGDHLSTSRAGLNTKVVENYEPVARISNFRPTPITKTVEEYVPPSRSRTLGSPRELEHTPSKRTRTGINTRNEEPVASTRSRTRPIKRPTESPTVASISSRANQRGARRRTDFSTTAAPLPRRGPSVFSEEIPPTRSRTGRKIGQLENTKTQVDSGRNSRSRNKGARVDRNDVSTEKTNIAGRRQSSKFKPEEIPQIVTQSSRHRFNARAPLNIDETKLEVLPLFEGETKLISESGRRPNQLEPLMSSLTENENLVIKSPENITPKVSIRSDYSISKKETVGVHSSFTRKPYKRKKESVVSQVTEVTSKRTITRKPIPRPSAEIKSKLMRSKLSNKLTSSEEDISDSDNYPAPFKALIQSKKQGKESRTLNAPEVPVTAKKVERIVSSSEAPRSVLATPRILLSTTVESIKDVNYLDNEVQPKVSSTSTLRTTRKRFYPSAKNLDYLKNKKGPTAPRKLVSRSTLAPAKEPKDHKFHSKFNLVTKNELYSTLKPIKGAVRSLYSSRKNKENEKNSFNRTRNSLDSGNNHQVPQKKSSKYSSKYRINTPSRSVTRTSTAPPAYIPTVPTVRSYTPTVKSQEDPELGLEFITIDDPPRSISSASLISGDYQPSQEAKSNSLDSQQDVKTTKKTPSIIESIINSITGINIPTDPTDKVSTTSTTVEPTKSSAILSLAPKKTAKKSDETDDLTQTKIKSNKRDASTSEKPTTVIQRILNSLSAIQAATTTETTTVVITDTPNYVTKQVGTNFNTLSSGTTTPSRLDSETASFFSTFAHSTTINPLVVFDTISEEQILKKRTIGKLLEILNSLTTQHPDSTKLPESTKLVYVTPKIANYFYTTPSMTLGTMTTSIDTTTNQATQSTTDANPQTFTSSLSTMGPITTESPSETVTNDIPSFTITQAPEVSDTPLSISLELSTTAPVENKSLSTTTSSRIASIISNIRNFLAPTTPPPPFTSTMTTILNETTISTTTTAVKDTSTISEQSDDVGSSSTTSTTDTTNSAIIKEPSSNSSMDLSTIAADIGETTNVELTMTTNTISTTESILPDTSTIPTFSKFEVSPDSVAIFSVNDLLSNAITPDDFLTTTISIPTRAPDAFLNIDSSTFAPFDISTFMTQPRITSTPIEIVATTDSVPTRSMTESSTLPIDGNAITLTSNASTEATTTSNTFVITPSIINNVTSTNSGRTGKLLQRLEDDVSNSIDSSSMGPDYFIFAVLPNNTILRKRPVSFPKETPFVIVGVFPNNTIIRKFPNGTIVPMEPVIRVSGFDTRPNPPPLPDITSNQVTPDQGDEVDNPNLETVSSMTSTVPSVSVNNNSTTQSKPESITMTMMDASDTTTVESVENESITSTPSNPVSTDNVVSSSTPVSTTILPSISELLDGKIVQAFNSLVNNTPLNQESTTKRTTEIISLEQLLRQQIRVKPWNRLEDNNLEIDKKVEEKVSPTTDNVKVTSPSIPATTGIPYFFNSILSTLQSIRTTGMAMTVKPTSQLPLVVTSEAITSTEVTTPIAMTTTTLMPTTTTTTTSAATSATTPASTTTTVPSTTTTTTTPSTTTITTTPSTTATTTTASTTTTTTTLAPTITTTRTTTVDTTTTAPYTSQPALSARSGKRIQSSTLFPYFIPNDFPLLSIFSTDRTRRTNIDEFSTTKKIPVATVAATTKIEETTESLESLLKKPIDSIKTKKQLTEQQKKDLETIRQLEKEQAAILKQLSFLTNLNLNTNSFNNPKSSDNLASRIIALAKEREGKKIKPTTTSTTTTTTPRTTTTTTLKPSKPTSKSTTGNDDTERMRQIESLIKLLNMNGITPSPEKSSTYGTTNDAILAALLKERGIGPATPKQLAEQIEQAGVFTESNEITTSPTTKPTKSTTKPTKKRRLATQPTRGPILQRLNWLLNALAPPPTKTPARKPKATTRKPKPKKIEEDILTSEPTQNTPVVTAPPSSDHQKTPSQEDIQKLIRQLEAIQKNPSAAKDFDLTSFKSLQNLNKNNVQVFMPGLSGISQRETAKPVTREANQRSSSENFIEITDFETSTFRSKERSRPVRTSTLSSSPVSNSILDDIEDVPPTKRSKPTLAPVKLRPVNGVSDEAGSMIRGRLLSAAVNVTRAISGFLGSAFQEAAKSLARALSGGSFTNYLASSSVLPFNQSTSDDGAASSFQTMMASGSQLVGNFAQGSSAMVKDTGE